MRPAAAEKLDGLDGHRAGHRKPGERLVVRGSAVEPFCSPVTGAKRTARLRSELLGPFVESETRARAYPDAYSRHVTARHEVNVQARLG